MANNGKIKVLVVDDSAFMRKVISDMVNSDSSLEVIITAKDGVDAIEKAEKFRPDVITLDIEMPKMDGLQALDKLTHGLKIPVIMFSSLTQEGAQATLLALERGAFDFLPKPDNAYFSSFDEVQTELIDKIKAASKVNLNNLLDRTREIPEVRKTIETQKNKIETSAQQQYGRLPEDGRRRLQKVVLIGTSTGGPRALQQVVPLLPKNLNAAVLIVQHMPPNFTKSLAERLNSMSNIEVKEAENGDEIMEGHAYIAPGNYHMKVKSRGAQSYVIELDQNPNVEGHRPSATYMMKEVAPIFANKLVGVIMTGMGGDGSDGMVDIKKYGGKTIAEDESTCVVFGMPKVAISKNAVDYVVPLNKIAEQIVKLL